MPLRLCVVHFLLTVFFFFLVFVRPCLDSDYEYAQPFFETRELLDLLFLTTQLEALCVSLCD